MKDIIDLFRQENFQITFFLVVCVLAFFFGVITFKVFDAFLPEPQIIYIQDCAYTLSTNGSIPVLDANGNHVCLVERR